NPGASRNPAAGATIPGRLYKVPGTEYPALSTMIKALIFDVGGVLLRTEDLSPRRKWEARLGLGDWGLAQAVFETPIANAATVGRAAEAQVWEAVRERLGVSPETLEELRRDFWAGDRFDDSILDWVIARRSRYRTGILSN